MLIVFLGYNILILVFLRSPGKFCAEILVFLGSAHFPCQVKMRSFQKFSVKFVFFRVLRQQFGYFTGLFNQTLSILLGFSRNVSDEHTYITSTLKVPPPPGILAFTPGKSLRRFRKDNNYLEKLNAYYTFVNNKRIRQ